MTGQARVVTFRIDDREVSAREDETVLQVARDNGIFIPTLCYLEGISAWGACRLCLVEISGTSKLLAACATHVAQDMEVKTSTPRVLAHRRTILELLFSERNHVCSVCVANGKCELQNLAQRCGVDHIRVPYRYPELPLDLSNDLFRLDPNRCVLCTRCVRVCDEIEGAHTWDVMGRGIECQVITDLKTPWGESESCTSCGKCVHVCPTGALTQRGTAIAEVHRHRDFLPYLTQMRGERD